MARKSSHCPHVVNIGECTWGDVYRKKQTQDECDTCDGHGPNLWLCLYGRCLYVGCGESAHDHSSIHAQEKNHCLTLNMTTMRIWCYECETEVFKDNNHPPLLMRERSLSLTPLPQPLTPERHASRTLITPTRAHTPPLEESDSEDDDDNRKPRGLTGLQNIGNTCYMNAAVQALSNCPPLMRFFVDCPGYVKTDKKPMLSKSYLKLMSEMWHKKRPSYVVPSSVAHGIKIVHPMFRGYSQQDSQEFLRCFMDQLHEELKQPTIKGSGVDNDDDSGSMTSDGEDDEQRGPPEMVGQSLMDTHKVYGQSDTEYETCDSGPSSERSSVEHSIASGDEGTEVNSDVQRPRDSQGSTDSTSPMLESAENAPVSGSNTSEQLQNNADKNQSDSKTAEHDADSANVECNNLPNEEGSVASNAKDIKDSTNLANKKQQQQNQTPGHPSATQQSSVTEETEFTDAMSELEPLQGVKKAMARIHDRANQKKPEPVTKTEAISPKIQRRRTRTQSGRSNSGDLPAPQKGQTQVKSKKKSATEFHSVISDIFDGKLLSSVQCLTCERVSSTKETFQDLSLPIPSKDHLHMLHTSHQAMGPAGGGPHKGCGEVSLHPGWFGWMFGWMKSWFWGPTIKLHDCLAAFFSADELKGDNMYSCERCKKLRNGMKYSKVLKLPEILCIHLKRFRHEFMFSSKISTYLSFPLEGLDMSFTLHKDCKDQVTLYDLVGVICHHGTAGGGHYTAYGLNYINEQWYEFDDQYVTEVDMQQVENCEAYVLFYRKRNDHMIPLRQKAQQIMEIMESGFMKFFVSKQWINRFNTFGEPGPISNYDFLCRHGGVHPHKWNYVGELVEEIPQKLWEFLHEKFGGGPAVNHLYQCSTCQLEMERLRNRQKHEMEKFLQLHDEFQKQDYPGRILAVSMAWFKDWENFVRARTEDPPAPIDNNKICMTKSGQMQLRINSDYGQLSEDMWLFLMSIYGGGPEVILKGSTQPPAPAPTSTTAEEKAMGDGSKGADTS